MIISYSFAAHSQSSIGLNTPLHRMNFEGAFDAITPSKQASDTSVSLSTGSVQSLNASQSSSNSISILKSTPIRRPTLDKDSESVSSKKLRKEDSIQSNLEDYRDAFNENLTQQSMNHQLQNEVLKLQQKKVEIEIETRKIELEKAKEALRKERALAEIEIDKQKRLADLEIQKMRKELNN